MKRDPQGIMYKHGVDGHGHWELVGAIVGQAIRDYKNKYIKRADYFTWIDAKEFLFDDNRLEDFLEKYRIQDILSCEKIRKHARKRKLEEEEECDNQEEYDNQTEVGDA